MSKENLAALQVGKTTRAEVLERFGKPNRLDYGQFAIYEGQRDYGTLIVPIGRGDVSLGPEFHILLEFDKANVLERSMIDGSEGGLAVAPSAEGSPAAKLAEGNAVGEAETLYAYQPGWLEGPFERVAVSPDGRRLAAVTDRGRILLRHLDSGTQHMLDPPKDSFSCGFTPPAVTFSQDGTHLAVLLGTITLFDVASEQEVRTFKGHGGSSFWGCKPFASALAFSPDGTLVASGDQRGRLKLWSPATGLELRTLKAHAGKEITSIAFSPDGHLCATAARNDGVKLWDTATWTLQASRGELGRTVAFSPDGKALAIHTGDHVEVWQLRGSTPPSGPSPMPPGDRLIAAILLPAFGDDRTWLRLAFSPDGERLAAASSGAAVLVELAHANPRWRFIPTTDSPAITDLVFGPDGKRLYLTTLHGVYLRHLAPGH